MCEHAADQEGEVEERRLHLDKQREDHCIQFQIQQQLMTTMIMIMGGWNMVPQATLNVPQMTLCKPTMETTQRNYNDEEKHSENQDGKKEKE